MVRNDNRRTVLLDAALDVLAGEGARGLTFRAIDAQAGVPAGTTSNYFADRDAILEQAGGRAFERFAPAPTEWERLASAAPSSETLTMLMQAQVRRLVGERAVFLALLELRLEATRRPVLQRAMTDRIRADFLANVAVHESAGMPGGSDTVLTLVLALQWLVVQHVTLPEVLGPEGSLDELVARVVANLKLE